MLYLITNPSHIYDKLEDAMQILNDICPSTLSCFVLVDRGITMEDGKKVRGRYLLTTIPTAIDNTARGVILIDEECNFKQMCTVLVHEYSHHLSQSGHNSKLFNLFKNWLRESFVERWEKHVKGRKNKRFD